MPLGGVDQSQNAVTLGAQRGVVLFQTDNRVSITRINRWADQRLQH
ncbi:hypothetical protein V5O39_10595 [Pseudomonas parakoreensis]